jgi:hypothetical protein
MIELARAADSDSGRCLQLDDFVVTDDDFFDDVVTGDDFVVTGDEFLRPEEDQMPPGRYHIALADF